MIFPLWKSHAEGLHSSLCTGPNRFHALWPNGRRWAYQIVLDSWILSLSGKARAACQHDVAFTSCCCCPQLEGEAFYTEQIRTIDYSHRLGVAFLMFMVLLEIKIMGAWSLNMGRPFWDPIASYAPMLPMFKLYHVTVLVLFSCSSHQETSPVLGPRLF